MTFFRHGLITLLLAGLIAALVAATIIVGGRFDVSVSAQLPPPIHDLIHLTRVNAVKRATRDLQGRPADLNDRQVLLDAVRSFQALCADCHSPPGFPTPPLARSLNPPPADLTEVAGKRTLEELFWVTKHGIRMSAMPAWGQSQSDERLWAIATLVAHFAELSAAEYRAVSTAAE
ncbi:MAG: c-type cytochrome [Wenzhouxiangella sp.]